MSLKSRPTFQNNFNFFHSLVTKQKFAARMNRIGNNYVMLVGGNMNGMQTKHNKEEEKNRVQSLPPVAGLGGLVSGVG